MKLTLGSLANHSTDQIGAKPADHGLAGALGNLPYAAIRPLRYRMLYYKLVGDLTRLDDEVLSEIGIARWGIRTYARSRAELRWPARQSLWAVLVGVAVAAWRALQRGRQSRMTIRALMALDDPMLKEIGLSRSQIPWIADELARHMSEVDMATTARSPETHNMVRVDDKACLDNGPSQRLAPYRANTPPVIVAPANHGPMVRAS
jgi:uncharacterized protein YjiS (DUF1127 family)